MNEKKISVKELPHLIGEGNYGIDVMFHNFPDTIKKYQQEYGLELNPDFQRGHVWSEEQQRAYIEYIIAGGMTGRDFYFNHPGWMDNFEGEFICVDGLQRITSIMKFFDDKLPIFNGYVASEIAGLHSCRYSIKVHINSLQDRNDVLRWYIQFNAGGTPHTKEEIERVRNMIK